MTDSLLFRLETEVQPLAAELLRRARGRFPEARVTSTRRTCAEQNAIYAQGRTTPGAIVTNARGCQSWHVCGRALDIYLGSKAKSADYKWLGAQWVSLGGKWGGDFGDPGHFEYHPGLTIERVCPNPDDCRSIEAPLFYGFPGLALKSPAFRCELWNLAVRLGVNPNWLAAVLYIESGFDSKIRNVWCMKNQACAPSCCAVGLIQFMPSTAKALGTSTTALYAMTDIEQLSFVERFYKPNASRLRRPVDVYMAVFMPAFIGSAGETVLGRKGDSKVLYGSTTLDTVYTQNAGFDSTKRGYFTVGDIGAKVESVIEAARKKEGVVVDCTGPKAVAAPTVSSSYLESEPLPTLQRGMCGEAVRLWQRILRTVKVDGDFGPLTENATKAWQKARGLRQDGEVSGGVWSKAP